MSTASTPSEHSAVIIFVLQCAHIAGALFVPACGCSRSSSACACSRSTSRTWCNGETSAFGGCELILRLQNCSSILAQRNCDAREVGFETDEKKKVSKSTVSALGVDQGVNMQYRYVELLNRLSTTLTPYPALPFNC
jgi:hypothetical protein